MPKLLYRLKMRCYKTKLLFAALCIVAVFSTTASAYLSREAALHPSPLPPGPIPPSPYEPLPESVSVLRDHTLVRLAPTTKSLRRGVVMKGSRLPVFETSTGEGCENAWYRVHGDAWICSSDVSVSNFPPGGDSFPIISADELTPWRYGFVHRPTIEYRYAEALLEEVREMQKGFGFGVEREITVDGRRFYRTAHKTLVPREDAHLTRRISTYDGVSIENGRPWPLGWIIGKNAFAYTRPAPARTHVIGRAERYTPFQALEIKKRAIRFDDGAFLQKKDVRISRPATRPETVGPGEKWIDIDVSAQILTAYVGDTPVYAALVSTGREGPSKTVEGEYRIWAKVAAIAMDNTDDEPRKPEQDDFIYDPNPEELAELELYRRPYSLHEVPWTQFFFESYALHGVYWHDDFGYRRSHGCVNLSPRVARRLFEWTSPRLPEGFWAIHSTQEDPGTLVRVR